MVNHLKKHSILTLIIILSILWGIIMCKNIVFLENQEAILKNSIKIEARVLDTYNYNINKIIPMIFNATKLEWDVYGKTYTGTLCVIYILTFYVIMLYILNINKYESYTFLRKSNEIKIHQAKIVKILMQLESKTGKFNNYFVLINFYYKGELCKSKAQIKANKECSIKPGQTLYNVIFDKNNFNHVKDKIILDKF